MMRRAFLSVPLLSVVTLQAQVIATGSMRATMREGQLGGLVRMDTIAMAGIYGLGPLEYLQGEITVVDGVCHVSSVARDGSVVVEQRDDVAAPFFVHAQLAGWRSVILDDGVRDLPSLDAFLDRQAVDRDAPFVFRMTGMVRQARIHVMDVPPGAVFSSPEDAHRHRRHFDLQDREVELLGFYSRDHRGVFTHHDSNIHLHLITIDGAMMGHLDQLELAPGAMALEMGLP